MQLDIASIRKMVSSDLLDLMIRAGLVVFFVIMCVRVFAPFAGLMLWALILAVALYPLQRRLAKRLGGRQGRAATLLVLAGLLLIGLPTVMLGSSFAGHVHDVYSAFRDNQVTIPPPAESVAGWPLIGERIYAAWSAAASDLPAFLERLQPQLGNFAKYMLSVAAQTAGGVLLFLGSLIIAGIMMAYGESGSQVMLRIVSRLAGPARGPQLHHLVTATIRSVAMGVIGVAFIQALLLGIGFMLAGIPGAGLLALIVMLVGIMQLPALIVSLPVIGYMWWAGDAATTANIVFTVYLLLAGMADNVLKPMLLGRGVDVPMPVILLGALGGMVTGGIIGLFLGAVALAVGYELFMSWVDQPGEGLSARSAQAEAAGQASPAGE